jgi:hypothetical protein
MIGDKKRRSRRAVKPDARALLAEADAALAAAREYLADLRQRRAKAVAEHGAIIEGPRPRPASGCDR